MLLYAVMKLESGITEIIRIARFDDILWITKF